MPSLGKLAITIACNKLFTAEATEELRDLLEKGPEQLEDLAEKLVEERIESFRKEHETFESYRVQLATLSKESEKPIVIFIDELDRCRPDFALRLIERIKHFFDVDNLVFVLLLNKEQIHAAIKALYGPIDASNYLSKFIQLPLGLPPLSARNLRSSVVGAYIKRLLDNFKFPKDAYIDTFCAHLELLAAPFELSLRDLERAFTLLAISYNKVRNPLLLAYLIVLKLKHGELFRRALVDRDPHVREAIDRVLNNAFIDHDDRQSGYFSAIRYMQTKLFTRFSEINTEQQWASLEPLDIKGRSRDAEAVADSIIHAARLLETPIKLEPPTSELENRLTR